MSIEKSALEKLSIHELRDLARQVGVHLPTTMKRDDLSKEIMAIVSGEKEPYKRRSNQGRPPKMARDYSDITEILLPLPNTNPIGNKEKFVFNANNIEYRTTQEIDFSGYVKVYDNYGVVRTKNLDIVFVTYATISKYELVSGDYVVGFAKETKDNRMIATSIMKINNVTVQNYKRPQVVLKGEKVSKNSLGNNITIGGMNLCRTNDTAYDIAMDLSKEYSVVLLNINSKEEKLYTVDNAVNIVNINFNMEDKDIYEISDLAFDIARTSASQGKEIVMVVNSLTSLIKAHNTYLTGNFNVDTIKSEVIKNVKTIMMYPYVANNSSLTIIDVENRKLPKVLDEVLSYELYDFFDSKND